MAHQATEYLQNLPAKNSALFQGAVVGEYGLHHMTIPQTRQRARGQIATVGGVVQETCERWRLHGAKKDLISGRFRGDD